MPNAPEPAPTATDHRPRDPRPRRVTIDPEGPLLVEGPVEVVAEDGSVIASRRFTTAICTCRRSRTYPWCDTSHRRRVKTQNAQNAEHAENAEKAENLDNAEDTEHTKGEEAPDDR
ncbi:CDGSH iron-sulfur domain-containing protein [Streptomyces sp. NPDC050147]|uniref:CDGSH iron-sulfur domain-containing protein n=1 Tax=Streptomyces sp. NPDC050147 TaxID=3155513 RepID=UPI00343825C2